ncbi:hypothetical protein [Leadbetterella byssophila]|uniref:hypothetical protein n=1 Tax=Leadbetterella byssophila TaxID=316068 RepID=UPI0039A2BCE4
MRRFLLIFLSCIPAFAQKPQAHFLEDSVMVGKEIKLAMSYTHSSKSDVVFPDSSYDFTPFKFVSYELFETKTIDGKSLDSVVYTLVTYELDSVLYFQPSIKYLISREKVYADSAKVYLKSSIKGTPRIKETVPLFVVKKDLNLPKITYYLIGLFLIIFVIVAFFGDWFKQKYRLFILERKHKRFLNDFKKRALRPKLLNNNERAVQEWKMYMEELEQEPISTMSTSELGKLYQNLPLEQALKTFDSAIFGGVISEELPMAYNVMQNFAVRRYRQIRRSGAHLHRS